MAGDIVDAAEDLWRAKQEKDRCNAAWKQAKAKGRIPDAVDQANNKANKDYDELRNQLYKDYGYDDGVKIDGIVQEFDGGARKPRRPAPKPVEDSKKQAREGAENAQKRAKELKEREEAAKKASGSDDLVEEAAGKGKNKKADSKNPVGQDAEGNPVQGSTDSPLGFSSQYAMPLKGNMIYAIQPGQQWWELGFFMDEGWFQRYWDKGYEEGKREIIRKEAIDNLKQQAAAINSANGAKKGDKNYIDLDDDKKCAKLVKKAADEGKGIFISPKSGEPEVLTDVERRARMEEFSMETRPGGPGVIVIETREDFARDLRAQAEMFNAHYGFDSSHPDACVLTNEQCDKLYEGVKAGGKIVFGVGGDVAAVNEDNEHEYLSMFRRGDFKPIDSCDVSPPIAPTLTL
ncbi:MAG: hypothetical protein CMF50_07715 [Legionellales bacterium]|nr:hypothetical protein [Legionellales bacterium]|tara:strand:- start:6869 stop:8077 length:1209 start_codon:yes stop_codon:yes gene_type:complete